MPISDPQGLDAMALIPEQINAHYTEAHPAGHRGETREQRLREFTALNPSVSVLGLPEGTALHVQDGAYRLLGSAGARRFRGDLDPQWLPEGHLPVF